MSYDVIAVHAVKTADGKEIKGGDSFPYDPDNLQHQQWLVMRKLKVVRLEEKPKVKANK